MQRLQRSYAPICTYSHFLLTIICCWQFLSYDFRKKKRSLALSKSPRFKFFIIRIFNASKSKKKVALNSQIRTHYCCHCIYYYRWNWWTQCHLFVSYFNFYFGLVFSHLFVSAKSTNQFHRILQQKIVVFFYRSLLPILFCQTISFSQGETDWNERRVEYLERVPKTWVPIKTNWKLNVAIQKRSGFLWVETTTRHKAATNEQQAETKWSNYQMFSHTHSNEIHCKTKWRKVCVFVFLPHFQTKACTLKLERNELQKTYDRQTELCV